MAKKKGSFPFRDSKLSPMAGMANPNAGFGMSRMGNRLSMAPANPRNTKGFLNSFKSRGINFK